jgi:hypothetical protein
MSVACSCSRRWVQPITSREFHQNTDNDQITYLPEYYLTNAEIDVLERSATGIAEVLPAGAMVIELGSGFVTASGNLRYLGTNGTQKLAQGEYLAAGFGSCRQRYRLLCFGSLLEGVEADIGTSETNETCQMSWASWHI